MTINLYNYNQTILVHSITLLLYCICTLISYSALPLEPSGIGYAMYCTILYVFNKIEPPIIEAILVAKLLSFSYAINPNLFGYGYYWL